MTNINEVWQAALAERGDRAFELFEERWKQKSLHPLYFKSNNDAIDALNANMGFCLKPIAELVKLDIEWYGEENYLLMYDYDIMPYGGVGGNCSDMPVPKKRKLYANAPFNLEWAMAGGAGIEFYLGINDLNPIAVKFIFESPYNYGLIMVEDSYRRQYVKACNLRHPFPPAIHSTQFNEN